MILTGELYKSAKVYIEEERASYDSAIYNHIKAINRDYKLIEFYKTKNEANINGLIRLKEEQIVKHKERIAYYKKELQILRLIPMKRKRTFMFIMKTLNFNIMKQVLKGGVYVFPFNIGKLSILVADKTYGLNSINWSSSMANVNRIAKKVKPELYEQYKTGKIKQFEYMQAMKYELYPTPNKPRWIVLSLDIEAWYIIFKRGLHKDTNKYLFRFRPTYFISLPIKTVSKLKSYFTNTEEILDSKDLGFKNKLLLLKTFFNEQKYYYNDISNS